LISDLHSNLAALETALADLKAEGCEEIVCLGDIVGYGPDPNACVERVEAECAVTILGNHDQAALGDLDTEYFNEYARTATDWTANALTDESMSFLQGLPLSVLHHDVRLVHASPLQPEEWTYVLSLAEAERQFLGFDERVCFIGHSHLPVILESSSEIRVHKFPVNEAFQLSRNARYIINVGSVGQPRDRDRRAACAWYDTDSHQVCLRRLDYDIKGVQQKILDAGLPTFLASRLAHGM